MWRWQSTLSSCRLLTSPAAMSIAIRWSIAWASLCLCATIGSGKNPLKTGVSRHIRSLLGYPDNSGMGIFFAIGIPVDVPDGSVSVSFYFEANYQVPHINNSGQINASETYFVRQRRGVDRRLLYDTIENHFDSYGYRGRACLRRTICESARFPFAHSGLVGDLTRIIFTPSTSMNENLEPDVEEAEYAVDCLAFEEDCPISLLDLISGHSRTMDSVWADPK